MNELTLEDEEDMAVNNRNEQRPVKLKTYNFKKPQFMKKMT